MLDVYWNTLISSSAGAKKDGVDGEDLTLSKQPIIFRHEVSCTSQKELIVVLTPTNVNYNCMFLYRTVLT
jgi:hypothetical protein